MKQILYLLFGFTTVHIRAQDVKPDFFTASYFGETVTHPGIKLGIGFDLKSWETSRVRSKDTTILNKQITFIPTIGGFYHKRFQTAVFVVPELQYTLYKEGGNYFGARLGIGYMYGKVPDVYELTAQNEINRISVGYHYLASNFGIVVGKDFNVTNLAPVNLYAAPQLLVAIPSTAGSLSYFVLEIGVTYHFN